MTETLETSLDIETRNQARSELAFGMLADAYPIVADQYNLDGMAYFGGSYLKGEPEKTLQNQNSHFQSMVKSGGR